MNIVWLDELDFLKASGGGERYKQHLHKYLKIEHNISCYTPNYYIDVLDGDLFIISDPFNRPNLQPRQWFNQLSLDKIINSHKYITFDTGWSTICHVDYFPCNGVYKGCVECSAAGPRQQWLQKYYNQAAANIFLSPLHKEITEKTIECQLPNSVLLGPTIDFTIFYDQELERDIDIIYSGVFTQAKGCHHLIREYGNTNKKVVIMGDNLWLWPLPENFEVIGKLQDIKEIAAYYNRSKAFWAKTSWPEAFGLSSVEARLCGCEIITNGNLGSTSWNVDWNNPIYVVRNNTKCWKQIQEKINVHNNTVANITS
jgi:glycosyltransferase involved in cell wall biosynthesis